MSNQPLMTEHANFTAGREVLRRVEKCILTQRDFSVETTLAGGNAVRQMKVAKNHDFEITLYYVGLSNVDLHISRVAARVRAGTAMVALSITYPRLSPSWIMWSLLITARNQ